MTNGIYLDNSTTTRPSAVAIKKMIPFMTQQWGTPSAPHQMGQELFLPLQESYKALYTFLGAKEDSTLIMTSSGSEAVNHVIYSVFHDMTRHTGRNQFITSYLDEAPAIMSIGRLESMECVCKMAKANERGFIPLQQISDMITPRTALVSLSWANGLTGVINPVAEIAALCKERGILFHLDASHILGKLYFDLEELGADFITFSGDLIHGPKGTGGLYIKAGIKCSPFITGGSEQAGYRAGSFNMPGLVGLACAAGEAMENQDLLCTEVARLRDKLETTITNNVRGAVSFFREEERVPHVATLAFPGVANEAMLYKLNRKGVFGCIGGGSFQQIGLILTASGVDDGLAHCAVSFSLSRDTTEEEVDRAAEIIIETAQQLQKTSHSIYPESEHSS